MLANALLCFLAVAIELPAAIACRNSCQAVPSGQNFQGLFLLQRKRNPLRRRPACSIEGADCRSTKCCIDEDLRCYKKNKSWAACKKACDPSGADIAASNRTPWSCRKLIGDSVALVEERTHATDAKSSVIAGNTTQTHAVALVEERKRAAQGNSSVIAGNTTRIHAMGDHTQVVGGFLWWPLIGCILGCLIIGFASVACSKGSHEEADSQSTKAVHDRDIGEGLWIQGDSNKGQIDNWYRMVILNSSCHQILSDHYFKVNAMLNMTQVIFAAIAGSSVFASIGQGKITTLLGITAGFFSMSSAVLTAVRKEMNYEQAVEQHTQAGKTFVILAMKHEELRLRSIPYIRKEMEPKAGADNIDKEWQDWYNRLKEAIQESPFIDSTTWEKMKASHRKARPPPVKLPIVLPDVSS